MVSFIDLLSRSWGRSNKRLDLAVVPVLNALVQVSNFEKLAQFDGIHFGLKFPVPAPIMGVWSFTSLPNPGGGGDVQVFGPLWALPLFVVFEAVLMAGYVGSLDDVLTSDGFDFPGSVREYFLPMLVYNVLGTALLLGLFAFVLAGGGFLLVLIAFPLFFALVYFFWAAPFLVVIEDRGVIDALSASYDLGTGGGEYFEYFWKHVGVGAVVSLPITGLVVNTGVVGAALGAILVATLGQAFVIATITFLHDFLDDSTPIDLDDAGDSTSAVGESGAEEWKGPESTVRPEPTPVEDRSGDADDSGAEKPDAEEPGAEEPGAEESDADDDRWGGVERESWKDDREDRPDE